MARIAQNTPTDKVIIPTNVPRLKRAWSCTTGAAIESSPIVVGDVVYIGSTDHNLYALEARTGALRWSYTTGGGILSSPAEADGMVYVGHRDHTLYALDAGTGQEMWNYRAGDIIDSSPAVTEGVVYVGSNDHSLYSFNQTYISSEEKRS